MRNRASLQQGDLGNGGVKIKRNYSAVSLKVLGVAMHSYEGNWKRDMAAMEVGVYRPRGCSL